MGSKLIKGPVHQTDSSHSRLGRRLRQVAGGLECWGGIWMGGRVREGSALPRRRRRDSPSSSLLISFPQGKARHMGSDIGRPWQMAE